MGEEDEPDDSTNDEGSVGVQMSIHGGGGDVKEVLKFVVDELMYVGESSISRSKF
jgi:hypothetical protein